MPVQHGTPETLGFGYLVTCWSTLQSVHQSLSEKCATTK